MRPSRRTELGEDYMRPSSQRLRERQRIVNSPKFGIFLEIHGVKSWNPLLCILSPEEAPLRVRL